MFVSEGSEKVKTASGTLSFKLNQVLSNSASLRVQASPRRALTKGSVMDRRRSCESSDSESRSLRTAGLAQPAGPRHSPAPTGVGRGTSDGHGWAGSKVVETMASRVGRTDYQDLPLQEF